MRKSKRELTRDVETLSGEESSRDGFHYFKIGGDPDADVGGYYRWDSDRGAYVNGDGHERPPESAPDSEFEYNVVS